MSFKELISEIGPEKVLPEKLMPILFQLKSNEIEQCIALLVSEIIAPGSQGLSRGLADANTHPEANARGAHLASSFRVIESDPKFTLNWYQIFTFVQEQLYEVAARNESPSLFNLTQLLSSLDFKPGLLDIFLSYDWWFDWKLLYVIHISNPSEGFYSIDSRNNLTLCFENESLPRKEHDSEAFNVLKFVNVSKLEVQVLAKQQKQKNVQYSEFDQSLIAYLEQVFERDYTMFPEYLIAGAIAITERTPFVDDLMDKLLTLLMNSNSQALDFVLLKFKEFDVELGISKIIKYYFNNPNPQASFKVLNVAGGMDSLTEVIDTARSLDRKLGMSLLIDAINHGYDGKNKLESDLNDAQKQMNMYETLVEILESRASQDFEFGQQQGNTIPNGYKPLSIPTVFYLLDLVKSSNGLIDAERLKNLQLSLLTTYPRLINFGYDHDEAILANEKESFSFPSQVEQEMKSYYSRMYNKEMEIKDIVDMLVRMKMSDNPHDQDVFACMIHSLLDEYRFFAEYPLSALASTSLLFGALLENDLIQGTTLTVALNFIWESCNQPQDSHLFKFAIQSLYNFKSRLHEYPIYCKHLLECQSLYAHAKMYQIVKDASNGIPCSNGRTVSQTPEVAPKYQSINVSDFTMGNFQQEKPNDAESDKLLFYVNNMTDENMKLQEIKSILKENYFLWFSNYLVRDRAKSEPNNHDMYSSLVEQFDNDLLYESVLHTTFKEIESLIRNFKESSIDRNNLKNLGAWLGRITLARDKPLKRDAIAIKFLLIESFDLKTLHLIIPFVCKIIQQAQYSRVFKPPNPWVVGILQVLVELYACADLKLNLKFEIEVLLNAFDLKIEDVEQSTIVTYHVSSSSSLATVFGAYPDTTTVVNDMSRLSLKGVEPSVNNVMTQQMQMPQVQPQTPSLPHAPQQPISEPSVDTSFSSLVGNSIFTQHANLRRAFQASMSRAVRECAVPILSRVSEAVLTTAESLIRKDFACEADPVKFRKSYRILAEQLAHSMVVCSGRKILSEAIESTMLQLLGNTPNEIPLVELSSAIQANVGLCVDIVDRIAADNIRELIDEKMLKYRQVREQHTLGQPFIDESVSEYALQLPQPLGLRPEGLDIAQLKIYESFGTNGPSNKQDLPQIPDAPANPQMNVIQEDGLPSEALFAAFTQNCEKAISLLSEVKETRLNELTPAHAIMNALTQALSIAQTNALKYPEFLLKSAQYAVNCLFTQAHENPMSNEIYVVLLDRLCEYSPSTAKDVTWWLVNSTDQRKFNMPVIYSLLKVQLIQPTKLDSSLSRLISESGNPIVVKFAANLLLNVYASNELRPIALRSEFGLTLNALRKIPNEINSEEMNEAILSCNRLLDALENPTNVSDQLYAQMGYVFAEWIKLLTHGDESQKLRGHFIEKMLSDGILTDPKFFETFFKAATEIAIASFAAEHEIRTRTQRETYLAVDTLAELIVEIILRFDDSQAAFKYLKNVLGLVILVFTNDHEMTRSNWNERAYFRFFSSLICSWNDASCLDKTATSHLDNQFYTFLGEIFNSLQPIIYPGFTFAWISLIAHRMFLPRLLELPNKIGYNVAVKLLTAVLKFQSIYSKETSHDVISVIFKAVNRIFTGLLHDYPEFFVECHYQIVSATPAGYTQLKNIVLSAVPPNVTVPDPFMQGLKVERLSEINVDPEIAYKPVEDLVKVGLKKPVENFLRIPAPALMRSIYVGLKLNHPRETNDTGFELVHYNVKLINALVLHIGMSAVDEKLPNNSHAFNAKSSHVTLLVDLMNSGSSEFKFHLINGIANQLRYPNSHTHWFIGIVLHFFSSNSIWTSPAIKLNVQELIIRVLLERRIVSKPHPWGLTIVFTELIKNDDYGFFELPFVRDAEPELKRIFEGLSYNFKARSPSTD